MSEQEKIQLFEDQKIRTAWDEDTGQRESSLPCWTMQNGRTSIRLSSVP